MEELVIEKVLKDENGDLVKLGTKAGALMKPEFEHLAVEGNYVSAMPENQCTVLDITTNIGGCSGLYYSMVFQLFKWGYWIKKIDESMDVSPVYAEAYNLTTEQKHKLEGQIKQGLASAGQAVADYELIKHDMRKYKEILDLLREGVKGKKEDHVLRALFIDRVDVHVGENFSLVTMVKRWPTIIADFIRLPKAIPKDEDQEDTNKIMKGLEVTSAEAHVLKTKNKLYKQWKESFRPEITERYARLKNLVQARERSVNEYREWLKPYVARYKMMSESLQGSPEGISTSPLMAPGFGNSLASSNIRLFAWRPFYVPEPGKPQRQKPAKGSHYWPVDDIVLDYAEKIQETYKVWRKEIAKGASNGKNKRQVLKEIVEIVYNQAVSPDPIDKTKTSAMSANALYYILFDIKCSKTLIKIPKGGEVEDMGISIKHFLLSQNVLLTILVELRAMELQFKEDIDVMIGAKEIEDVIKSEVEKDFEKAAEGKENKKAGDIKTDVKKIVSKVKGSWKWLGKKTKPYKKYFFRPGPYENTFQERVTQQYMIPMGGTYLSPFVKFLKWKAGVPGMPEEY